MKKLLSAVCLLLVAAVMLGSTTFAWFSMNGEVTATGMSVSATAPNSLLISNTSTGTFGSTAALTDTNVATNIDPVAHNNKFLFAKLTTDGAGKVDGSGSLSGDAATEMTAFVSGTYKDNTTFPTSQTYIAQSTKDFFTDDVYIKYTGASGSKSLEVSASYLDTSSTENIKKAMHIVFVDKDGTELADIDMGDDTTSATLCTITANADATKLTIYYYLSGADGDCVTSNITADATLSVDLTFSVS